jgi:peptide/nickel transport system substrate-binding protein
MNGVARRWLTTDEWDLPPKRSQWMRDNPVDMVLMNAKVEAKSDAAGDAFTVPTANANPHDIQWNPYFAQAGTRTPTRVLFEPLFNASPVANDVSAPDLPERTPILGNEIRASDGTLTIEIADDRVWTDGDAVTAEDLAVKYRLEQYLGQATGDVWDTLNVVDEHTLEFDIGERNPELAASVLTANKLENTKRDSRFAEWVEAYDDATTDEERTSVSQEVVQTRVDDLVSYGLWEIDSRSTSRIVLTVHDDHPLADTVTFDRLEMPSIPNNQTRWQSLGQGRIDALFHATAPKSTEADFPDHAMRLPFDNVVGDGIVFNHGREPFDDRRVRQAVAMLINRWTNTHNAKDFVSTIEYPTGLTNRLATEHLGDDLAQFERYGYEESKPAEAERLLQAAGYTRE